MKAILRLPLLIYLTLSVVFPTLTWAQDSVSETLKKLGKKYHSAQYIQMNVEKEIELTLTEKKKKSVGKIWAQKGKFRFEIEEPTKSLFVYDGLFGWAVTYPPKGIEGKIQVMKGTFKKGNGENILLSLFLGQGVIQNYFHLVSIESRDDIKIFHLKAKDTKAYEFEEINVGVNEKNLAIKELYYKDKLENQVKWKFDQVKFDQKFPETHLKFTPPPSVRNHSC